jgi:hypothetical protein
MTDSPAASPAAEPIPSILAEGDTVILTEDDRNDSKFTM